DHRAKFEGRFRRTQVLRATHHHREDAVPQPEVPLPAVQQRPIPRLSLEAAPREIVSVRPQDCSTPGQTYLDWPERRLDVQLQRSAARVREIPPSPVVRRFGFVRGIALPPAAGSAPPESPDPGS